MNKANPHKQDDVVSKPFRIGELIPKIEELSTKHGDDDMTTVEPPTLATIRRETIA